MAGRLFAFEIRRSKLRVSVIGPIGEEVLASLAAEVEDELKWVPGGVVLSLPLEHAAMAHAALKSSFESFLDNVMARVRPARSRA